MSFFKKIFTAGVIGYGILKIKENLEDSSYDSQKDFISKNPKPDCNNKKIKNNENANEFTEWEREKRVNLRRTQTPVMFDDGISCEEFTNLATMSAQKVSRITSVKIRNATIYCTVESQKGLSSWEFSVDFNDWGHITGTYWHHTENHDSLISKHFAETMKEQINHILFERSIFLEDFSTAVENNSALETGNALNDFPPPKSLKKLLKKSRKIICRYNSKDLLRNHLYPVISFLKQNGFQNIKSIPIKDVCKGSQHFPFQVEQVLINGSAFFEEGNEFNAYTEIIITYHIQKELQLTVSPKHFFKKDYVEVCNELASMGFSNIYEKPMKDLSKKWSKKDGSVIQIKINDIPYSQKNSYYRYDDKIVVEYHSYRF